MPSIPQPVSSGTRSSVRLSTRCLALKSKTPLMSIFRTTRPSVKEVSMAFGARWAWVQIPTSPFTSCVTLRNFFNLFILYFIIYKIDTNNAYLSMFVRFLREPSLCLSHKYPINSYFLSLSFPAPIFSITCQREINCGFPESTCVSGEHT